MVIQTSPHTEPASLAAQQSGAPKLRGSEAEPQGITKKNQLGVFARILAGLTNKGLPKEGRKSDLPAEIPEKIDQKPILNSKTKNTKKKSGDEHLLGHPHLELSVQEKNILSHVKIITDQAKPKKKDEIKPDELKVNPQQPGKIFAKEASEEKALSQEAEVLKADVNESLHMEVKPEQLVNEKTIVQQAKTQIPPAEKTNVDNSIPMGQATKVSVNENDNNVKQDNVKSKDKKRNLIFDVKDFRSTENHTEGTQKSNGLQINSGMDNRADGVSKEISLELRLHGQGQENSKAATSWEVKAGNAFEDMLARELHQNFNNDIVRHASMALREGSGGHTEATIRLTLKPESLGNVKIHLKLAENKITGVIFVDSEDALRAFEREISSLEKAFQESGFEGANLEMSLAADGRGTQQWQETEASRSMSDYFAASRYDEAIEGLESQSYDLLSQGTWAINMLV